MYLDFLGEGPSGIESLQYMKAYGTLHRVAGQARKLSESVQTEAYTWYEYIKQISDYRMIQNLHTNTHTLTQ